MGAGRDPRRHPQSVTAPAAPNPAYARSLGPGRLEPTTRTIGGSSVLGRATTRSRRAAIALAAGLTGLAMVLSSCGTDAEKTRPEAGGAALGSEVEADTAQAQAAAPPASDRCYRLGFDDVLQASNTARAVPCRDQHTARTVSVGRFTNVREGHLVAPDSRSVQDQVARACRASVAKHLGGPTNRQLLSRFEAVWFTPTAEALNAGARWYRCDVVLIGAPKKLTPLPASTRGILRTASSLRSYGTCGTASPAASSFRRVLCAGPHTWKARAVLPLSGSTYLGEAARRSADARCRAVDEALAADRLVLKWSFEWPTREQWANGQRYGFCWTPDPA